LTFVSVFAKIPNMDKVFKALSDPTRRKILKLLREREMSAGELAEHFSQSKPTLSGHFAVLREADLVMSERSGTTITYRLNLSVLEEVLLGFGEALKVGMTSTVAAAATQENHHD
jgi:DNA-binding transcriptional ArsR family regulator